MPRAIVNITCPWCGGRVAGIESLDVPRTMPCPYCRTELHVPHVGKIIHERIVREVIAPEPVVEDRTAGNVATLIFGLLFAFIVVTYLALRGDDSHRATSSPPSSYELYKTCTERCEASCGPEPDDGWSKHRGYDPSDLDGMNKHVDWSLCRANCSLSCSKH